MKQALDSYKQRAAVLGALAIVFGCLTFFGLWMNGNGAVERYNALIATDTAGGDVERSLRELRTYIYSHMNSEIGGPNGIYPPIQLKGTYDRLLAAEEKRVETTNANLYSDAQSYCEQNGSQSFSGGGRLECIDAYVDRNGAQSSPVDDALYKFDFVAPRWSPDLAGFSMLLFGATALLSLFFFFRYRHTRKLA